MGGPTRHFPHMDFMDWLATNGHTYPELGVNWPAGDAWGASNHIARLHQQYLAEMAAMEIARNPYLGTGRDYYSQVTIQGQPAKQTRPQPREFKQRVRRPSRTKPRKRGR